jgi:hypothetical protein
MNNIDITTPLTKEELDSIADTVAEKVVERRLETPAILFLEMHKPLTFIASQAVLVAMPMIGPVIGIDGMATLSKLLRDRENIELLISRIEEKALARDARPPKAAESQG